MTAIALLVVFPFCMAYSVFSDILTMTISNKVPLVLVAAFFAIGIASGMPVSALGSHAAIGVFALLVTFGCFAAGWMGGGDAKLIAATVLWFGPGMDAVHYMLISAVYGAVLTISLLYARSYILPVTGIGFVDRLLGKETGVPYGVALGAAGLTVFSTGVWMDAAIGSLV